MGVRAVVSFDVTCDLCPAATSEALVLSPGCIIPIPELSPGWHTVDRDTLCPNHQITVSAATDLAALIAGPLSIEMVRDCDAALAYGTVV